MSSFCECGSEKKYNKYYDSLYCELCNKWLERKCDDADCGYCAERPDRPSQAETVSNVGQ